jgi:hypothetical protein
VKCIVFLALAGGCWSKKKVTNWINSGGPAARRCKRLETTARSRTGTALSGGLALILTAVTAHLGYARDRGQFGNVNPDLKAWFESLKSGKGPCCSDADGTAISDADWESGNGHYRVRVEGEWVEVPDEAVITEPNRVGLTMVWPIRGYGGLTIRCFMPGSMT